MREMKDSGIEWIGAIPLYWQLSKIKYLSDTYGRIGFRGYTQLDLRSYGEGAITLSPSNFSDMKMNYDKCTFISWDKYYESPEIMINNEDILYVKTGSTYGKSVYVTDLPQKATINPQLLVFKNIKINKKLFSYFLQTSVIRNQTELAVVGGTIPTISQEKINNFIFIVPSENEQQQIANYLDRKCAEIDSLVSDIQRQIELLEEYKRSVITEAVTKGLDKNAPMKDSGIEWIGDIPEHWEIKKIKYIGSVRNGLTYTPQDLCDNGTLVLRSSNVQNGKLSLEDNVYVSCNVKSELMIKKGDILICSRNGSKELIGKNAIITEDINAAFGAFMMILRCDSPKYLYYILNSNIFSYYLGTFFTSTINQLTGANFNNMKIVYCEDKAEQSQIISYLDEKCDEIDSIISEKKQQLEAIEEYKKSLIFEYVTGKREVTQI